MPYDYILRRSEHTGDIWWGGWTPSITSTGIEIGSRVTRTRDDIGKGKNICCALWEISSYFTQTLAIYVLGLGAFDYFESSHTGSRHTSVREHYHNARCVCGVSLGKSLPSSQYIEHYMCWVSGLRSLRISRFYLENDVINTVKYLLCLLGSHFLVRNTPSTICAGVPDLRSLQNSTFYIKNNFIKHSQIFAVSSAKSFLVRNLPS